MAMVSHSAGIARRTAPSSSSRYGTHPSTRPSSWRNSSAKPCKKAASPVLRQMSPGSSSFPTSTCRKLERRRLGTRGASVRAPRVGLASVRPVAESTSPTICLVSGDPNGAPEAAVARVGGAARAAQALRRPVLPRERLDIPDAEYDALKDELVIARGALPRARRGELAHTDGRDSPFGLVRARHAPHAHDEPRQGHDPRGDPRLGRPSGEDALARRRVAVFLRAEDRRAVDLAHLRAGPARAWRHPR